MKSFSLGSKLQKYWGKYERQLSRRPFTTQMVTSAVLWGVADVVAQRVGEGRSDVDLRRSVVTAGFGSAFMGPVGHLWYSNLDNLVSLAAKPGTPAFLVAKVLVDSFLFGPCYVAAFYAWGSALIDRDGVDGFVKKMKQDFVPTFMAELAIWPLFQAVNFSAVPVQHQLLAVNMASLADATFLSWARSQDDWVGSLVAMLNNKKAAQAMS